MAYITHYNAERIVSSIYSDKLDSNEELYHKKLFIFSKKEKQYLLAFKSLMKGETDAVDAFKHIEKRKDTFTYVKEWDNPSYHLDPNCPRLNSSFTKYKVPDAVEQQGKDAVKEFRKWYNENEDLLGTDPREFSLRLQLKYGVSELEKADYDNSGVEEIENLSLEEIETKIDSLINKSNKYYFDESNNPILYKFLHQLYLADPEAKIPKNDLNRSDEDIKAVLLTFREEYKKPINRLLKMYFRAKFNPELKYDVSILDQLGFKPCSHCCMNNK